MIQIFYVLCCSEVQKALQTARSLYSRWCELAEQPGAVSKEEYDWTTNELRNSLRSIEWDLEDLEETVDILSMCTFKQMSLKANIFVSTRANVLSGC